MIIRNQNVRGRVAMIMALITFWSTTGFSFSLHFCQHQFQGLSASKLGSCCVGVHQGCQTKEGHSDLAQFKPCDKNCCVNTQLYKKGAEELPHLLPCQLDKSELSFVAAIQEHARIEQLTDWEFTGFEQYRPPLIVSDLCVSLQVFRI